jgi:phosphate transport system protein
MSIHFQRELSHLRKQILAVGAAVEDAISQAIAALLTRDGKLAEVVVDGDNEIDRMEIEVEEECLKILALYQPVANDLRFIVAVLKMNNDLERMGDHAANIAKRAGYLAKRTPVPWPSELELMAENVKGMVKGSLDALINHNGDLARQVCIADDEVDRQKQSIASALREELFGATENRESLLKMIDVPRHLERIADLATNVAEDVVYLAEGHIARHHHED